MARKTSKKTIQISILTWLLAGYMRLLRVALRWEVVGRENLQRLIDEDEPFVMAAWHSRLLMVPPITKQHKRSFVAIVSEHRDGEIIAQLIDRFGINARRGSKADPRKPKKNKGGAAALKSLVSDIKKGHGIYITPDGPRGPRQRAQPGVAQLSRLTGKKVLPFAYSVRHGKQTNSWDRFLIPYLIPFTKGVFVYGEPIEPPKNRDADLDAYRQQIEDSLNHVMEEADRRVQRPFEGPVPLVEAEA